MIRQSHTHYSILSTSVDIYAEQYTALQTCPNTRMISLPGLPLKTYMYFYVKSSLQDAFC